MDLKPTFKAKITFHFSEHERKQLTFGPSLRQIIAAEIEGVEGLNSLAIFSRTEKTYLENDSDEFDCRSIVESDFEKPFKVGAKGRLWAGAYFANLEVISVF